jgi:Type II secretion system (T2SS), protein E, N-terminal domain
VTDEALALAFRSGMPFVGLRDHASDPDLDRIVPPDAARTARALPLAAENDHIRLAVADPDADLSALDPYLTGRQVDLALAPREELDAILGPPPAVAAPEQTASEDDEADHTAPAEAVEPEPSAPAPGDDEAEPLEADHAVSTEAVEPELPAAAATEIGAEPPAAAPTDDESEPFAAASSDHAPDPLAAAPADDEPEPAGEPDRGALSVGAPSEVADDASRVASEADLAAAGEERAEDLGGEAAVEPSGDAETAGVVTAEPSAPVDHHPELAGEVPSWLEPPQRGRRVLLTVLIVIVALVIAAAVVVAFLNV